MIKNIGVLVILVLIVVASYIVISKSANPGGERYAADIESLNKFYQSPANYAYTRYVTNDVYDAATSGQKKYIAAHAVVVNKDAVGNVARLKELAVSNIPAETIATDTAVAKIDSIYELQIEHKGISGDVDLSADEVLYFPIAHDERWHVVVDITDLKPFKVNNGRMGIFIEKGRHHIALVHKFRLRDKLVLALEIIGFIGLFFLFLTYNYNSLLALTRPKQISPTGKIFALVLGFVSIFIIVYFYFIKWKTNTVYGDDLYGFQTYYATHSFLERLNLSLLVQKYRPVHGFMVNILVTFFGHNLDAYYIFNVAIVSINTFILALTLNLFLNSYFASFLLSLTFGLSRFFIYCINQLLCGGSLEGLSLMFFLCFLFLVLSAAINKGGTSRKQFTKIFIAILFANLSLYTHERYIVLFAFILFMLFSFEGFKGLSKKQKGLLYGFAILSPLLNVFIKKQIYSIPFFVGTGGVNIKFSSSQAQSFLQEAILSIFQINTGPEYLVGLNFTSLPIFDQILVILVVIGLLAATALLLYNGTKSEGRGIETKRQPLLDNEVKASNVRILFFLSLLFMLCLAPAIVTIRLEPRWLTASLSIFILACAILFTSFKYKDNVLKYGILLFFICSMLRAEFSYSDRSINKIFMHSGDVTAGKFKRALNNGIIHPAATKLYLWEKHKNAANETGLRWILADGYFFKFYGAAQKQLTFVDSTYIQPGASSAVFIPDFDAPNSQIILPDPELKDLTTEYLRDSLKSFLATQNRRK